MNVNDERAVYAWVSKPFGARWSLIGMANEHGHLPMISHDLEMMHKLRGVALEHLAKTGQPVQLVRWSSMSVLEHHEGL